MMSIGEANFNESCWVVCRSRTRLRPYFLGDTASAALVAAHGAMPNNLFYLTRVGQETAHTVKYIF